MVWFGRSLNACILEEGGGLSCKSLVVSQDRSGFDNTPIVGDCARRGGEV